MARRRKERPAKKFGTPLYCAVWPKGNYAFVGGGGGKSSSGIANKIVTVHCENGQISGAEAGGIRLQDAPMRMALPPQETTLAVALGDGGILTFGIARDADGVPVLQQLAGKAAEEFAKIGVVECMAFSSDGRYLGVGTADGALTIYDWQTGRALNVLRAEHGVSSAVRDLSFSPAHQNKILAAVGDDGTCALWAWQRCHHSGFLDLPKELKGGAFSKVQWTQDSPATLYAVINLNAKSEGYLVQYEMDEEGFFHLKRQSLLFRKKVTAFTIVEARAMVGTGTVEGDAAVFSLDTCKALAQSADAHMVFVTAVAFNSEQDSLLSVSADASAWVTRAGLRKRSSLSSIAIVILLLVFLVLCCAAALYIAELLGHPAGLKASTQNLLKSFGLQPAGHSEL